MDGEGSTCADPNGEGGDAAVQNIAKGSNDDIDKDQVNVLSNSSNTSDTITIDKLDRNSVNQHDTCDITEENTNDFKGTKEIIGDSNSVKTDTVVNQDQNDIIKSEDSPEALEEKVIESVINNDESSADIIDEPTILTTSADGSCNEGASTDVTADSETISSVGQNDKESSDAITDAIYDNDVKDVIHEDVEDKQGVSPEKDSICIVQPDELNKDKNREVTVDIDNTATSASLEKLNDMPDVDAMDNKRDVQNKTSEGVLEDRKLQDKVNSENKSFLDSRKDSHERDAARKEDNRDFKKDSKDKASRERDKDTKDKSKKKKVPTATLR